MVAAARRRRWLDVLRRSLWALLFALIAVGCGESTITVFVYTDISISDYSTTNIVVARGAQEKFRTSRSYYEVPLPNVLQLENGDTDSEEPLKVTVEGVTFTSRVSRIAQVSFDPDRDVVLPMPLCRSCLGVDCPEGQTCVLGECAGWSINASDLPEYDGADSLAETECASGEPTTVCTGQCGDTGCGDCLDKTWIELDYLETTMPGFSFAIASREVNRKQYDYWLATNPQPAVVHPDCEGITSYEPGVACMADPSVCQGDGCDGHPQVCIDWCAADAYCRWARKRLCSEYQDTGVNEWQVACWAALTSGSPEFEHYPYGQGYDPTACNGSDSGIGTTVAADSMTTCSGGFPDLFHMSGNVSEWTADQLYWGGSFESPGTQMYCSCRFSSPEADPTRGFRCCSDAD